MNAPITINPNRIDLDEAYMQMAEVWAMRSKANRKQVGALIVKDRQIISDGYNGMPAGDEDDTCEEWYFDPARDREPGYTGEIRSKDDVLHAESNALAKIAENGGVGAQGATLYVTMSPCKECAKLIKQAKIKRVVFRELYRDTRGIESLLRRGVKVEQLGNAVIAAPTPPVRPTPPPSHVVTESGRLVSGPPPSPMLDQAGGEVSRLRSLAAIAGRPAPMQGPTLVEPPAIPPVQGPTIVETPAVAPVQGPTINEPVIIDDMGAALAAAGITLVNGVPVERSTAAPKPQTSTDDGIYRSTFS